MSDRVYAKAQTGQKTLSGLSLKSSLLQRTYACGRHTLAGGECEECRKKRESTLQRSAIGMPSIDGIPPIAQEGLRFGHDFSRIPTYTSTDGVIQTKLALNKPGDEYEREADRVADQVLAAPAHPTRSGVTPRIQRFVGEPTGQTDTAPASVDRVLASVGRPLDPAIQQDMGQRFGHDFSQVRVHTDERAAESARAVNALAYTVGRDIVFGTGQYVPETRDTRRLLTHELMHVIQQTSDNTGNNFIQRASLASPRLAGNPRFENVLNNRAVIEIGDRGPEVRRIQQLLIDLGFNLSAHGADGKFGTETANAVKAFQFAHGLTVDGRVGFATISALDSAFPAIALPATRTAPWSMPCVLGILCPWNKHLVEDVLPSLNIITFDSRKFPTETWNGTTWVPGTFESGGFTSGTNMGFLNTTTCQEMALTIYHEGWHAQQPSSLTGVVDTEKDAYINTEQWSISAGLPGETFLDPSTGTIRSLRTTRAGETVVNEPAAERLVRLEYGGVSAIPGERVLSRVGASNVRVRRPNGSEYIRPARIGESVRGAVTMTNQHTIDPASWTCP